MFAKKHKTVPSTFPSIAVEVGDTGEAFDVIIAGSLRKHYTSTGLQQARKQATKIIADYSSHFKRPLIARVKDPTGTWRIQVSPDGSVSEAKAQRKQ